MVKSGKKNVLLSIDEELLGEARKVLFKNGSGIQQFIVYVLHKLTLEDETAVELLNKLKKFNVEVMEKENRDEVKKINSNALYEIFEEEDTKNKFPH